MVRLRDLHEAEAKHMRARADAMQPVDPAPWITPKSLRECHVAIVSTAGLHRRSDAPFNPGAVDYRLLPGDVDFADVVVSHISTNFDRSAFQQDPNIWFPLDRLREMAAANEIGGVAKWHYSFMGAQPNHEALKLAGEEVGRLLAAEGVDIALMVPV
ncbi:MAG: glycine/sarcosine/betaine reductase selenoprotein B family protein [Pseudomonadales bacterium]|nr:glycine/sarcosine/betaine reductase selenoprotein B family protein [Pseudomonadales bacterium]